MSCVRSLPRSAEGEVTMVRRRTAEEIRERVKVMARQSPEQRTSQRRVAEAVRQRQIEAEMKKAEQKDAAAKRAAEQKKK